MFISGYQTAQITGVVRECFRFFLVLFLKKFIGREFDLKKTKKTKTKMKRERERERERKKTITVIGPASIWRNSNAFPMI